VSPNSIHGRVMLAAILVLLSFIVLTGLALDRAFAESVKRSVLAGLEAQVYLLLGEAEPEDDGTISLPAVLPEARLATPGSGLYAQVVSGDDVLWRSESATGRTLRFQSVPPAGVVSLQTPVSNSPEALFGVSYGVIWEQDNARELDFRFEVATDRVSYDGQLRVYRRTLWGWLSGAALVLLAVQALVLRWGLSPLRRVVGEVDAVEIGAQTCIEGGYPVELQALTDRLNALVMQRAKRIERYRAALADLAHALKTPLAVLRASVERDADAPSLAGTVSEQVARMDRTVNYQLQRATAMGGGVLAAPVRVRPIARRITASLTKVYQDKRPEITLEIAADFSLKASEDDIYEILGNLMDNACKWCDSKVIVRAQRAAKDGHGLITVCDDGPGFDSEDVDRLLHRGARADESTPGHGIGLAVVRDLVVDVYDGRLQIVRRAGGGAAASIHI
jgi:two-component system sensor histidine kinase PhoQ